MGNHDASPDDASFATVGGGEFNLASEVGATVSGGILNKATGHDATVSGGANNEANGIAATVSGGSRNAASGSHATVSGGNQNSAIGDLSFAAGLRANANHQGSFVWADSTNIAFSSTASNQFLIRAAGGVGIGTNTPNNLLTVNGKASFGGTVANVGTEPIEVQGSGAGVSYLDRFLGGGFRWVTYADNTFFRFYNGAVGNVAFMDPAGTLHLNGAICATNFPCSSDARLKEQVTGLRYGLRQLLQLRPVSWQWKDRATPQPTMGLIAQEVEPIMPELVLRSTMTDDKLGLNYLGLLPVTVRAIQEQQTQIVTLQQQNTSLKQQNTSQQQLLNALQKRLATVERALVRKARKSVKR